MPPRNAPRLTPTARRTSLVSMLPLLLANTYNPVRRFHYLSEFERTLSSGLRIEVVDGIPGVVLRRLRLHVIAQPLYCFGSLLKGKRGLIIGTVDAHHEAAQCAKPCIASAELTGQLPMLFQ